MLAIYGSIVLALYSGMILLNGMHGGTTFWGELNVLAADGAKDIQHKHSSNIEIKLHS